MPTPAEEHRLKVAQARAGEIKTARYTHGRKKAKGNRAFARKDKGRVRDV